MVNISKVARYTFAGASIVTVGAGFGATGSAATILWGSAIMFAALPHFFPDKNINVTASMDRGIRQKPIDRNAALIEKLRQQQMGIKQDYELPQTPMQPVTRPTVMPTAHPKPQKTEEQRYAMYNSAMRQIAELKQKIGDIENRDNSTDQDLDEPVVESRPMKESKPSLSSSRQTTAGSFNCPICGDAFDHEHQMNMHIISKHKEQFRERIGGN